MKRTALAALAATLALAAQAVADASPRAPQSALGKTIRSERRVALESNTTRTYRMRLAGLGENQNALEPCWGLSIAGPGVDLAIAEPKTYGPTVPEPGRENEPDGGVPGAVRQPDGSFAIPRAAAKLDTYQLSSGPICERIGWAFYDKARVPKLRFDRAGNLVWIAGQRSAKAAGRLNARTRRTARRQLRRGRIAKAGPVAVTFAGVKTLGGGASDMVVTVRTGALRGATTLALHARVIEQRVTGG